ncbi:TPA: hypothetical protein HA265_05170 [Candidatus Woesearchaeota archaeon]|nr:hypothetical protein [Candidatus Woesearchaeota archaeon]
MSEKRKKKLSKQEKEEKLKELKRQLARRRNIAISVIILVALVVFAYFIFFQGKDPHDIPPQLTVLPGFQVNIFADRLSWFGINIFGLEPGPRMMYVYDAWLLVAVPKAGKVYALKDIDNDGVSDQRIVLISGLDNPHSVASYKDWIYIAEEDQVIRVKWDGSPAPADVKTKEVIIQDLPSGGAHTTRTITIHDDQLYVSIGSSCNDCVEDDVRRASVIQCELDRDVCDPFATGLRNAVGLVWEDDMLFATDNGRDWLGDDFPPDEINILKKNTNYGWPYCHGRNEPDPDLGTKEYCDGMALPAFDIQAHSAPLGLTFYYGNQFPSEYRGDLFVAYHGSWNRKIPTGYKVVRVFVDTLNNRTRLVGVEDFVSGWLTKNGDVIGRPVDVINWIDGSLLISDDKAGVIYRVSYSGETV